MRELTGKTSPDTLTLRYVSFPVVELGRSTSLTARRLPNVTPRSACRTLHVLSRLGTCTLGWFRATPLPTSERRARHSERSWKDLRQFISSARAQTGRAFRDAGRVIASPKHSGSAPRVPRQVSPRAAPIASSSLRCVEAAGPDRAPDGQAVALVRAWRSDKLEYCSQLLQSLGHPQSLLRRAGPSCCSRHTYCISRGHACVTGSCLYRPCMRWYGALVGEVATSTSTATRVGAALRLRSRGRVKAWRLTASV